MCLRSCLFTNSLNMSKMNQKGPGKRFHQKPKKKEVVLVFDEKARREFLTGFHKRKVQRKAKAAEELEKRLNLERKKIKEQTKLMYDRLVKSQKPVPEVSHLLTQEIDMGEHSVSVTEISAAAAAKEQNWIGENQVQYQEKKPESKENKNTSKRNDVIEGMDFAKARAEANNIKLKTAKDFKKVIKKEATQHVKKSKVFKKKSRAAQIKNAKRLKREERRREKQNKSRTGKHKKK